MLFITLVLTVCVLELGLVSPTICFEVHFARLLCRNKIPFHSRLARTCVGCATVSTDTYVSPPTLLDPRHSIILSS
uniref:Putative secreted peptide n=1 Tax=Anopheles braziliensis TaxID=58242 RepID=A0A2M3ZNE8_9DIPT